jgi:hypothetical protein
MSRAESIPGGLQRAAGGRVQTRAAARPGVNYRCGAAPLPDRGVKIGLAAHLDAARWLSTGIHPLNRVNRGGRAPPARYSRQPGGVLGMAPPYWRPR